MKNKGWTVNELAERLDVSRQALSRQIQGKMLIETAERIANALNVPVWQLFISEEDVLKKHDGSVLNGISDFIALIKVGGKMYSASSKAELRELLDRLDTGLDKEDLK